MSQENVELVRRFYAWLPGLRGVDPAEDRAALDRAFREYLDAEFETRLPGDYPEGEPVFRGREGLARYVAMPGRSFASSPSASSKRPTGWWCSSAWWPGAGRAEHRSN
jgi:hypothetical protein